MSDQPQPSIQNVLRDYFKSIDIKDILERVKFILTKPKETWPVLGEEAISIKQIYLRYLVPLALAGALGAFIRHSILGIGVESGVVRMGMFSATILAINQFLIVLAFIYIVAQVLVTLASKWLKVEIDQLLAFKLVAYSAFAHFVGQICEVIPFFYWLIVPLLTLYGIYLFYLGVQTLTQIEKKRQFTAAFVGCCLVCFIVLNSIISIFIPKEDRHVAGYGIPLQIPHPEDVKVWHQGNENIGQ